MEVNRESIESLAESIEEVNTRTESMVGCVHREEGVLAPVTCPFVRAYSGSRFAVCAVMCVCVL
jgi:hypothetical protein